MSWFVDTNVLIYSRDRSDLGKQRRALDWLGTLSDRRLLVISPQVMNEFVGWVLRRGTAAEVEEAARLVSVARPWCSAPYDLDTTLDAVAIRVRTGWQWFDCLLVAAAIRAGCRFFLSEDMQHDRTIGPLRIVDPFRVAPQDVLEHP